MALHLSTLPETTYLYSQKILAQNSPNTQIYNCILFETFKFQFIMLLSTLTLLPVVPVRAWFSRASVCGPAPPPGSHPGRHALQSTRGSVSPGLPSGCQSPRSGINKTETFKTWTEFILGAEEYLFIGNLHTNTVTPHTHTHTFVTHRNRTKMLNFIKQNILYTVSIIRRWA